MLTTVRCVFSVLVNVYAFGWKIELNIVLVKFYLDIVYSCTEMGCKGACDV